MPTSILYERAENMRYNPTNSEREFRDLLEIKNIPFKQQYVIGRYIADFLIGRIVVEIDGEIHNDREELDRERDAYISAKGYTVIRVKNKEVSKFDFSRLKNNKRKGLIVTEETISHLQSAFNGNKNNRQPKASNASQDKRFLKYKSG